MTTTATGLTRLPATTTIEEAVAVILRDGGVIIEGLYDDETIEGLRNDLNPLLEATAVGQDPVFLGTKTRRLSGLFNHSSHMVTVAMNPLFRGVANEFLNKPIDIHVGDDAQSLPPGLQVGVTQAIQIGPGQGSQPLHRDDIAWLWKHPDMGREARVQIMVAVSDFTAENGGTMVIPGSHQWDDYREPRPEEAIPTEMSAGSALLWLGSTYHGGGQNNSEAMRTGVTMSYDVGFLRAEETHLIALSLDTIRRLPETLQSELGWGMGAYVGFVEVGGQLESPMALLKSPNYTAMGEGLPATL